MRPQSRGKITANRLPEGFHPEWKGRHWVRSVSKIAQNKKVTTVEVKHHPKGENNTPLGTRTEDSVHDCKV